MRKFVLRMVTVAGVLLALGACTDNPTLSDGPTLDLTPGAAAVMDAQVTPQGCVVGGICLLPPISGGACEPWMELDWDCGDGGGTCMTSVGDPTDPEEAVTVQGCPGGDGGGGGGGPGGDGGTAPPPGGNPGGDPGTICPTAATGSCPEDPPPSDGICTADENGTVCEGVRIVRNVSGGPTRQGNASPALPIRPSGRIWDRRLIV